MHRYMEGLQVQNPARLWQEGGVRNNLQSSERRRKPPRPLDEESLRELAIRYVGRYATSRHKLASYLARKLRERGWEEEAAPDIEGLVSKMDELGFVDDEVYAGMKARSLTARGCGVRRVGEALYAAGIEEPDRAVAEEEARAAAFDSARRFACKRRIGPFASEPADPDRRQKQIAAFLRAGHELRVARLFIESLPGMEPDPQD